MLELGMHDSYISKTTLKKNERKKSLEFSISLADSREKENINQLNLSKT